MLAATQLALSLFSPGSYQEMETPTMGDSSPHNEQNHGNSSQICPETPLLDDARFSLVDNTKHHNFHVATQHHGGGCIYVSIMQSFLLHDAFILMRMHKQSFVLSVHRYSMNYCLETDCSVLSSKTCKSTGGVSLAASLNCRCSETART